MFHNTQGFSRASFAEEKRQHTNWRWNGAMRASAECHLQKRRANIHPEFKTRPQKCQQGIIHRREETTHILGAEWSHESISTASFAEEKR